MDPILKMEVTTMKKILSLIVIFMLAFTMSGCTGADDTPKDILCDTGYHIEDNACIEDITDPVCTIDQELVDGECVDVEVEEITDLKLLGVELSHDAQQATLFMENIYLSTRNIPNIASSLLADINTYEIMNADVLVITENTAKIFVEEEAGVVA